MAQVPEDLLMGWARYSPSLTWWLDFWWAWDRIGAEYRFSQPTPDVVVAVEVPAATFVPASAPEQLVMAFG